MNEHKPLLEYSTKDAMMVAGNPYQGDYKRVLCICSAGILRSATAALVLSKKPFNYNTRSAGVEHYALIPVTEVLLVWADEIICMTKEHYSQLKVMTNKTIICLNIPDSYEYRNNELQDIISEGYKAKKLEKGNT